MRWSSHTSFPGFHCGLDSRGRVCLCVLGRDPPPIFTSLSFSPSKLIELQSLIRSLFYSSAWCCLSNSSLSIYLLFGFFFFPPSTLPTRSPRSVNSLTNPLCLRKKKGMNTHRRQVPDSIERDFREFVEDSARYKRETAPHENQRTNDLDPTRRPRLLESETNRAHLSSFTSSHWSD